MTTGTATPLEMLIHDARVELAERILRCQQTGAPVVCLVHHCLTDGQRLLAFDSDVASALDALAAAAQGKRVEVVPNDRAIWQKSDRCKVYTCPSCRQPVFTQFEGDELPAMECGKTAHRLEWRLL